MAYKIKFYNKAECVIEIITATLLRSRHTTTINGEFIINTMLKEYKTVITDIEVFDYRQPVDEHDRRGYVGIDKHHPKEDPMAILRSRCNFKRIH